MLLLAIVPFFVSSSYILHLVILIMFYAVLSMAWNVLGGFAGQFSLGHSAFFGLGAYTSTILFITWKLSPWIGMFVGAGFAVLCSLPIGSLCFKLRGPYFSMITIAFAEVLRLLFLSWGSITGGAVGILVPLLGDSPLEFQFLSRAPYYYILFVIMLSLLAITYRIRRSHIGLCLLALREDEEAAESIGINVIRYKLLALSISVLFTAIAGTFYAQYILFLHPDDAMSLNLSIDIALPTIIGGMGTVIGPILGSFLLTPLSELIRSTLGGRISGSLPNRTREHPHRDRDIHANRGCRQGNETVSINPEKNAWEP